MTSLVVDTEDCLEQCEGTIADVVRLSFAKNEDGMKPLLKDYELFKFSESVNIEVLLSGVIEGPLGLNYKWRSKLKYVRISFSTSTFDRIKKVSNQFYNIIYIL